MDELFERQLNEFSAAGWEITARTNLSAQLKQPRRFDWLTLIAGILLSPALVGFIMILHVIISYTLGERAVINLTAQDVAAGRVPDFNEIGKFYYEKKGFWLFLLFLLLLVILFFVFLALLSMIRNR